ncbi:MAG: phosphatase PAP2 family protein [Rhodospirillaceae bacterium]|jgi:membrane-associated phospholipid phosphatase|nr:phosphatase PAP2 family protein [Rhodospirillaceae bacterium]
MQQVVCRSTIINILISCFVCAIMVGFSITFLDREIATWSHNYLNGIQMFVWFTWIIEPIPYLAVGGLAAFIILLLFGWRPGPLGSKILSFCLAVLVAIAIKEQLKFYFGRTWPETWTNDNPSWIDNGIFTFQLFHGKDGWASFPSGHTTTIAASMSVLWRIIPKFRLLWGCLFVLVAIGLLGANYHWLSDIITGGFLGTACGFGMTTLLCQDKSIIHLNSTKILGKSSNNDT